MFKVDKTWTYGKNKQWKTRFDVNKQNRLPVISGITINNGINYYTEDIPNGNEVFSDCLTISTRGQYSGTVTYHSGKFVLANNILVMPMPHLNKNQKIFIGTMINNLNYGGYNNYPRIETLKNDKIYLPIKKGKIDYDYMERFIAELEAQSVAELDAYLITTGLKDDQLTIEEQKLIRDYANIEFAEFDIKDIFNVKNAGNLLSRDVVENSGNIPYLCASSLNNAVSSYIKYNEKYLDKGNCIFIGGKTFVVTYQENDFYSNDSHNLILYLKNEEKAKLKQLYLVTCLFKSLGHKYSWGNSISKDKIKKDKISLPVLNGKPNFAIMNRFISAIQKLVIKDVVKYIDEKIKL